MKDEKPTRKLATILAADCVGFSKLMDKNEELTLQNIKKCRNLIDPVITENGGRILPFKTTEILEIMHCL